VISRRTPSRSAFSCSVDRFVNSSSARDPANASRTRSTTASEVSTNSADVPGVICSRVRRMKSSLMPTAESLPASAPAAAPIAAPSSGTRNSSPKSSPQKAPPSAPAPARFASWRVFGFFAPSGHVTVAASWTVTSCCTDSVPRVSTALSVRAIGGVETPDAQCGHRSPSHRTPRGAHRGSVDGERTVVPPPAGRGLADPLRWAPSAARSRRRRRSRPPPGRYGPPRPPAGPSRSPARG
jgi:hypothetical protein